MPFYFAFFLFSTAFTTSYITGVPMKSEKNPITMIAVAGCVPDCDELEIVAARNLVGRLHAPRYTLADLCQSSSIICSGSQIELIISMASTTP